MLSRVQLPFRDSASQSQHKRSGCPALRALLLIGFCSSAQAAAAPFLQQPAEPPSAAAISPEDFQRLLQDLSAPQFAQRQAAVKKIHASFTEPAGLQLIDQELRSSQHPERVRRLIEILEYQYGGGDFRSPTIAAISELLEQSALSDRWYVAESARAVLRRLWRRRVEIAVTELQRLRVPLQPTNPEELWKAGRDVRPFPMDPADTQHLRIFVDEHWPADPRAFVLLRRLTELTAWSRMSGGGVSIYQLLGHPLTADQTAELKGMFGDLRVEDRGRVCLGVVSDSGLNDITGAVIRRVEPGSSADRAGLRPDDLIQAVDGQPIRDFSELVTLLREYKVGDKVTLRVRSLDFPRQDPFNRPPRIMQVPPAIPGPPAPAPAPDQQPKPEPAPEQPIDPSAPRNVEVTLQGWYDPELLKQPVP